MGAMKKWWDGSPHIHLGWEQELLNRRFIEVLSIKYGGVGGYNTWYN